MQNTLGPASARAGADLYMSKGKSSKRRSVTQGSGGHVQPDVALQRLVLASGFDLL